MLTNLKTGEQICSYCEVANCPHMKNTRATPSALTEVQEREVKDLIIEQLPSLPHHPADITGIMRAEAISRDTIHVLRAAGYTISFTGKPNGPGDEAP